MFQIGGGVSDICNFCSIVNAAAIETQSEVVL